ncbi:ASCH domain-containing protein [Pontibacter qinzhouensis]|uniref:ASCH domain-containing protein n=1 Tax=Pontibacter qinzhouensis TaxID=2603253 RepID=A0A5C8KDQ5_9BACT|nr:ASCH domain-containing protein [Pontibacter qinzhouensis]TXK52875.1 ASCH domain-containing protein [Pontibacter qinzhouensis]
MDGIEENYTSAETLWTGFIAQTPDNPIKETPVSFYFCDNKKDADECAELVVKGIKQATATSLWWYQRNKEQLPEVGDQYVVTDWAGNAKAIIETTKIKQVPYNKVSAAFAQAEGEGDKSLGYWRKVHKAYYAREMKPYGEHFNENMVIVCEYFKTIFTKK